MGTVLNNTAIIKGARKQPDRDCLQAPGACGFDRATVPILSIYPFLQKYFVKGVMIGSIKA